MEVREEESRILQMQRKKAEGGTSFSKSLAKRGKEPKKGVAKKTDHVKMSLEGKWPYRGERHCQRNIVLWHTQGLHPGFRWSYKLYMATCPVFPRTVLVGTCCPGIIINRILLLLSEVSRLPWYIIQLLSLGTEHSLPWSKKGNGDIFR